MSHTTTRTPYNKKTGAPAVTTHVTTRDQTQDTESERHAPMAMPALGGNAEIVLVLGLLLFMFSQWTLTVKPLLSTVWSGKSNSINWRGSLGLLSMLSVMTMLSVFSEDMAGLMILSEIGMFMVYLIMNPDGNGLISLIDWYNKPPDKAAEKKTTTPKK